MFSFLQTILQKTCSRRTLLRSCNHVLRSRHLSFVLAERTSCFAPYFLLFPAAFLFKYCPAFFCCARRPVDFMAWFVLSLLRRLLSWSRQKQKKLKPAPIAVAARHCRANMFFGNTAQHSFVVPGRPVDLMAWFVLSLLRKTKEHETSAKVQSLPGIVALICPFEILASIFLYCTAARLISRPDFYCSQCTISFVLSSSKTKENKLCDKLQSLPAIVLLISSVVFQVGVGTLS